MCNNNNVCDIMCHDIILCMQHYFFHLACVSLNVSAVHVDEFVQQNKTKVVQHDRLSYFLGGEGGGTGFIGGVSSRFNQTGSPCESSRGPRCI